MAAAIFSKVKSKKVGKTTIIKQPLKKKAKKWESQATTHQWTKTSV
jgi:hypothetical protein